MSCSGFEFCERQTPSPLECLLGIEALVPLQEPGKDHLCEILRSEFHTEGLLGVALLVERVRVDLRVLGLQGARETLDLEVLVLGLQEELGRC